MNGFIDVHCHIIPGVDDGAVDIEETKRMLKIAYESGTRYIVATPHHHPRRGMPSKKELKEKIFRVREEARKLHPNFLVFLGTEVYYDSFIAEKLQNKIIHTMNAGGTILLEFSSEAEMYDIQRGIAEIRSLGYEVLLAHIERYRCLYKNWKNTKEFLQMGVKVQVNAGSIVGKSGKEQKKYVNRLLKERLVDMVGSDAHDDRKRTPDMREAATYVSRRYGNEYMQEIFFKNAYKMLRKRKEI